MSAKLGGALSLAVIPTFLRHQVINAHEAAPRLPPPAEGEVPGMHMHAGALPVVQSRKGKESKGIERKGTEGGRANSKQQRSIEKVGEADARGLAAVFRRCNVGQR